MSDTNIQKQIYQTGRDLAEGKWSPWVNGPETRINDEWTRVATAILLENQEQYFSQQKMQMYDLTEEQLAETSTMSTPGLATFEKYAFPMIRAIFPNLVTSQLVSVQPMMGPASIVFYLAFVYGTNKGTSVKGRDIWENPDQRYSSEEIAGEVVATGAGAAGITGNLSFVPVRKNTVSITDGVETFTDDGAGVMTGDASGTGTVDYATGAVSLTFNTAVVSGVSVEATYEYDMEANTQIPEVDLLLTSSPVVARPRKLRSRWSMEAAANLRTVHGLDAETELSAVLAEELKFEIDREIIDQLNQIASAGTVTFSRTPPTSVSFQDHKQSFVDKMVEAGNMVFAKTRRAQTNWIIMGVDVATLVEALPGFVPSGLTGTMGVVYTGTLQGRWKCFKDPYLAADTFITGYKGNSFLETGYIYAPLASAA